MLTKAKLVCLLAMSALPLSVFSANEGHEMLLEQSKEDQPLYLTLVLQDSGESCDIGIRSQFRFMDDDDSAYWSVECNDGNKYMITIPSDPESRVTITNCSVMESFANVKCFE